MAVKNEQHETSTDRLTEYEDAFILFDKDCDELLNASELPLLMRSLGHSINDGEINNVLKQANLDPRGKFTSLDFVNIINQRTNLIGSETFGSDQDVRDAFRLVFDPKGTGIIPADDIMNLLQVFGEKGPLTQQQIWELLGTADKTNTGQINYEDFIKTMTSG
jgi:Ca2+-binding EF-hand superfamily protein